VPVVIEAQSITTRLELAVNSDLVYFVRFVRDGPVKWNLSISYKIHKSKMGNRYYR
jgi:hypothetical protein